MPVNFTPREQDVLRLIACATLRKNIASNLRVSIHTVDVYLRNIHIKTNTHTMAELVQYAMDNGFSDKPLIEDFSLRMVKVSGT